MRTRCGQQGQDPIRGVAQRPKRTVERKTLIESGSIDVDLIDVTPTVIGLLEDETEMPAVGREREITRFAVGSSSTRKQHCGLRCT